MNEVFLWCALAIGAVLWREAVEWAPWLASKVLERAVLLLPVARQERMREEWAAELQAIPGKLSPLAFACHLWWGLALTGAKTALGQRATKVIIDTIDVALGSGLVVLFLPMLVVVTSVLWMANYRRWLLSIEIIGQRGRIFKGHLFPTRREIDGRYTKIGRWLAQTRIARLPLLFNVVTGDLSLVGPSPRRPCDLCSDCGAMPLKPGLMWTNDLDEELLEQFGTSISGSVVLYFKVLFASVKQSICTEGR